MRTEDRAGCEHDAVTLRRFRQSQRVVDPRKARPDEHAVCRLRKQFQTDALKGAHDIETRLTEPKTDASVITVGDSEVQVGIPEQTKAMFSAMIPLGRGATPAEAAGGIVYFCSPWSNYVTGQVLAVAGGFGMNMSA